MISIVTVNWWARDFAKLLVRKAVEYKAIENFEKNFEIVIVDNSGELRQDDFEFPNVKIIKPMENLRHGVGLDVGIGVAKGEYVLVLDIDAHLLLPEWDKKLISLFENNRDLQLACATDGELLKPMKPLAMFFRRQMIEDRHISFVATDCNGAHFDVGINAYFKILTIFGNISVYQLHYIKTKYDGVLGSEYLLNGERFCYHEWYGTRFYGSGGRIEHDLIDGLTYKKHLESKNNLFKQT